MNEGEEANEPDSVGYEGRIGQAIAQPIQWVKCSAGPPQQSPSAPIVSDMQGTGNNIIQNAICEIERKATKKSERPFLTVTFPKLY